VLGLEPVLGQQGAHVGLGLVGHLFAEGAQQGRTVGERRPGLVDLADHHARPEGG